MGASGKKLTSNPYERLHRQYCRRYGLNPLTSHIPKSELISDAAFIQAEADGDFPADRLETVLSAIFFTVYSLAVTFGLDPDETLPKIGDSEFTKPRKFRVPPPQILRKIIEDKDRQMFAAIADRFK